MALLTWSTWPAANQINVQSCFPQGLWANLSAKIYGNWFWRTQLADVSDRRHAAETWDQNQARIADIIRQSEAKINAMVEQFPSLATTNADIAAMQLRSLADKIESEEANRIVSEMMRKRVPALQRCEAAIIERVSP